MGYYNRILCTYNNYFIPMAIDGQMCFCPFGIITYKGASTFYEHSYMCFYMDTCLPLGKYQEVEWLAYTVDLSLSV